ncbi:MAG: hypothetical protein AB7P04_02225 [Bacteriovoracia bacterium]
MDRGFRIHGEIHGSTVLAALAAISVVSAGLFMKSDTFLLMRKREFRVKMAWADEQMKDAIRLQLIDPQSCASLIGGQRLPAGTAPNAPLSFSIPWAGRIVVLNTSQPQLIPELQARVGRPLLVAPAGGSPDWKIRVPADRSWMANLMGVKQQNYEFPIRLEATPDGTRIAKCSLSDGQVTPFGQTCEAGLVSVGYNDEGRILCRPPTIPNSTVPLRCPAGQFAVSTPGANSTFRCVAPATTSPVEGEYPEGYSPSACGEVEVVHLAVLVEREIQVGGGRDKIWEAIPGGSLYQLNQSDYSSHCDFWVGSIWTATSNRNLTDSQGRRACMRIGYPWGNKVLEQRRQITTFPGGFSLPDGSWTVLDQKSDNRLLDLLNDWRPNESASENRRILRAYERLSSGAIRIVDAFETRAEWVNAIEHAPASSLGRETGKYQLTMMEKRMLHTTCGGGP